MEIQLIYENCGGFIFGRGLGNFSKFPPLLRRARELNYKYFGTFFNCRARV